MLSSAAVTAPSRGCAGLLRASLAPAQPRISSAKIRAQPAERFSPPGRGWGEVPRGGHPGCSAMAIPVPVVFSMPVCVGLFFFFRVLILRKGILQRIQSESSRKVEAPGKGLRDCRGTQWEPGFGRGAERSSRGTQRALVLSSGGPGREESGRKGRAEQVTLRTPGSAVCKLPQGLGANFMEHCGQRFPARSSCRQVVCMQRAPHWETRHAGVLLGAAMLRGAGPGCGSWEFVCLDLPALKKWPASILQPPDSRRACCQHCPVPCTYASHCPVLWLSHFLS